MVIINGLLVFLIGCLVLAVIIYVFKMVLALFELPEPINRIALIIVGLIGLVILIGLATGAMGNRIVIF